MNTSVITSKGQTTVPSAVRTALRWNPQERLLWEPQKDGSVVVRPLPSVMELAGCFKTGTCFTSVEDETIAATKAWASEQVKKNRS